MLLRFDEVRLLGLRHLALPREHGPLGIYDLRDGALHVEDFVAVLFGERGQERGDDFHGLAFRFFQDARVLGELLDFLPLPIPFGIVLVGGALTIGHGREAAGLEDLHHEAGAGAGESAYDDEIQGIDGRFGGFGRARGAFGLARGGGGVDAVGFGGGFGVRGGAHEAGLLHAGAGFIGEAELLKGLCKEAVGGDEIRANLDGGAKGIRCLGEMPQPSEGGAEGEVGEQGVEQKPGGGVDGHR